MKKFYALLVIVPLLLACSGSEQKKEGPIYGGTESHPSDEAPKSTVYGPTKLENNPPELTKAELVTENGALRMVAEAHDKDGDPVQLKYSWTVNEQVVSDKDTLTAFKSGDHIIATVTPFDGKQDGLPRSFVRQTGNSPPQITQNQPQFNDPMWTYQVNAKDPDGDTLEYSLTDAPSGMIIDPKTGLITWDTSGASGRHKAMIHVSDGHGGTVDYPIEITLTEEQP